MGVASPLAPPCVPDEFPKLSKDYGHKREAGPVQEKARREKGEPDGAENWVALAEEPVGGSGKALPSN